MLLIDLTKDICLHLSACTCTWDRIARNRRASLLRSDVNCRSKTVWSWVCQSQRLEGELGGNWPPPEAEQCWQESKPSHCSCSIERTLVIFLPLKHFKDSEMSYLFSLCKCRVFLTGKTTYSQIMSTISHLSDTYFIGKLIIIENCKKIEFWQNVF